MGLSPEMNAFPAAQPLDIYEHITRPLELPEAPQLSVEEQVNNANYVAGALHASIAQLTRTARHQDKTVEIDTSNAWMSDIASSIIRGKPITMEPGEAIASSFGKEKPDAGFGPTDKLAIALGYLLRDVAPRKDQVAFTPIVQNAYDHAGYTTVGQRVGSHYFHYPPEVGKQYVLDMWDLYQKEDIIGPADVAGRNFTFLPTARFLGKTTIEGGIVDDLRNSEWGTVEQGEHGLMFYPTKDLQSVSLKELVGGTPGGISSDISLTDKFGTETSDLLYAAAIRNILQQDKSLHITGPNPSLYRASALLRALDTIDNSRYHSIGLQSTGWSGTTPDHYALGVARELEKHTQMFINSRKKFTDFKDFNAQGYAEQHYGGNEAVIEDQDICKIVSFALGKLDIRAQKAADIGCGPNPYPGMLLLPHAQTLDLLDFSQPNREYMQTFFSGMLPYNHVEMWRKFEKHMVEGGGDAYVGIFDAIREAASQRRVHVGHSDVFKLPTEAWDLMTAYFLIDSFSMYRSDQHDAIASINKALTKDGVAIFANMLNRADHVGYQVNGGQEFPNISQTIWQMKQAFTDNDMFSIVARVKHDKRTTRDGYNGMAVVFACHKNSTRRQQLINLIPELKQLGVDQII